MPNTPLEGGSSPGDIAERELVPAAPRPVARPRDEEPGELPRDRDPEPPLPEREERE